MTFEETLENAMQSVIPRIIERKLKPLHDEIRDLRYRLENPYGNKKRFTISELAEITGRSRSAIHKDIREDKLAAYQDAGNKKYIAPDEAMKYINLYSTASC